MTPAEKLTRLAVVSASIARRLYCERTWSARDKKQHKDDLAERDLLLASALPSYLFIMTDYRVQGGELDTPPARWKLRLLTRLSRWL